MFSYRNPALPTMRFCFAVQSCSVSLAAKSREIGQLLSQDLLGALDANRPSYRLFVILVRRVKTLPEYAWKTQCLPETAIALRKAFQKATSPEKLLFTDIPAALGVHITANAREDGVPLFFERLNSALDALATATSTVITEARDVLLKECGFPAGEPGWASLRETAGKLKGRVWHDRLLPMVERLLMKGDESSVLESVLAYVGGRPPRTWGDKDAERFASRAADIGALFRQSLDAPGNEGDGDPFGTLSDADREVGHKFVTEIKHLVTSSNSRPAAIKAALEYILRLYATEALTEANDV